MTASPAADWIPVIDGRKPDLPNGTLCQIKMQRTFGDADGKGGGGLRAVEKWCWLTITEYRLAPAQPAEGGWRPCSEPPIDGLYSLRTRTKHINSGECVCLAKKWSFADDHSRFDNTEMIAKRCEYFLPPAERAEATINAGPEVTQGHSASHGAGINPAPPVPAPNLEYCASCRRYHIAGDCVSPRPAPQRQNLAYWLGLRGRAPWPEPPRVILGSLPGNAFKEWSK